jgi:hypothetical protein
MDDIWFKFTSTLEHDILEAFIEKFNNVDDSTWAEWVANYLNANADHVLECLAPNFEVKE